MPDAAPRDPTPSPTTRRHFLVRLAIAALQGLALYLLTFAGTAPRSWPATAPALFDPLLLIAGFIPLIAMVGISQIRVRPLLIWLGAATLIIGGLGWHDASRGRMEAVVPGGPWPWFELVFALAAALFVAHALVVDSVIEGRWRPPYPRHFDTAWKQGVQVALGGAFLGVFWLVLNLGAGLFELVKLEFPRQLISKPWFAWPASTLALAVAIHVTDVSPALIRGARSLALTLFSWLAPVLALILLAFLASLPFISLAPLWKTHAATGMLLGAAALTVFLINTCHQDGQGALAASPVKRWAAVIGALELAPLVGLAAWALALRVEEYGWTTTRITAGAGVVIATAYAATYAAAVARGRPWLKGIETGNFVAAYLALALFLALFSPVADPARLMVISQMGRLESGKVTPEAFDFVALKFDGARWGSAALRRLGQVRTGPNAATIRLAAAQALGALTRWSGQAPTSRARQLQFEVYPPGRDLPPEFYSLSSGIWNPGLAPLCFRNTSRTCVARFVTLNPGDREDIIILDTAAGWLFARDAAGAWRKAGDIFVECHVLRQALTAGDFHLAPHPFPDVVLGGQRLSIHSTSEGC